MASKSKKILSEISAGELLDKLSILEIKLDKIENTEKKEIVNKEYVILRDARDKHISMDDNILSLYNTLKKANLTLWNIEDKIRIFEKEKNFGKEFIELARSVYINNDKRSKIKSEINTLLGSNIKEIKEYTDY
tara:strand:- start:947 stop:1348 length:402 start_codon:yes stop_codon:yes gene_type:complete